MVTLELSYELPYSSGMCFSEMTAERVIMVDAAHNLASSEGATKCKCAALILYN